MQKRAYNFLINKGYSKDNITVIMSEDTRKNHFNNKDLPVNESSVNTLEGMGAGGAIGGTIGAIAAAIAAIGTVLAIPGLGIVIAGPIAAAVAGAGAGGAIGGLVGALGGMGVSDDVANQYEQEIKEGATLLIVERSDSDHDNLENELKRFNS